MIPTGSESTSVGHVDVSYQRGSGSCSHSFNTYSNVQILAYKPGKVTRKCEFADSESPSGIPDSVYYH